jgi:PAS domain S-box-containing protein
MNEQWRRDDLVDAVIDYAICAIDLSGYVQTWNVGAERIFGYSAEEVLGRHIATFYPKPAGKSKGPEGALREAISRGRSTEDGWLVRRDGTSFWAGWVLTRRQDSSAEPAGFALVVMDLTPRRQADEQTRRAVRMNDRIEIAQRVRTCTIGELFRITLTLQSLAAEASDLPRQRMERLITDIDDVILNLRKHILQTSSGRGGMTSTSMPGGQSMVGSGDRWLLQGPPRLPQGVGRRNGAHPDSG